AQNSYGGPLALKRLVDAAHARGLAVILDVVYNHLGPEGNYLSQFGPNFTDRYKTAWVQAINFDGPHSDEVRRFFIHNALMWIDEFHVDALRVDAVHAIVDPSAEPFLQDLNTAVRERADILGRRVYMIAEGNLNDPRVITPKERFGLGFDSQWSDAFHGRGVWREGAVSIFHFAWRRRFDRSRAPRPARGVRRLRLAGRPSRPARRSDLPALEAELGSPQSAASVLHRVAAPAPRDTRTAHSRSGPP